MLLMDKASSTLMDSEILFYLEYLETQDDLGRNRQHKRGRYYCYSCCSNDKDTECIPQSQFCLHMCPSGKEYMIFFPVYLEMCLQRKVGTVFDLENETK